MKDRLIALGLFSAGIAAIWAGIGQSSSAITCTPQTFNPAYCVAAHERTPDQNDTSKHCTKNGNICQPVNGLCVGYIWGTAVPGKCVYQGINEPNPTTCIENSGQSNVTIRCFTQSCVSNGSGGCKCNFVVVTNPPPQTIAVCNCSQ